MRRRGAMIVLCGVALLLARPCAAEDVDARIEFIGGNYAPVARLTFKTMPPIEPDMSCTHLSAEQRKPTHFMWFSCRHFAREAETYRRLFDFIETLAREHPETTKAALREQGMTFMSHGQEIGDVR